MSIIDRAATLVGEFSEGTPRQQTNIADGFLHCASQTATHAGVAKFIDPFDRDDRKTIIFLRDIAVAGSEKFATDKTSNGMLACCGYAAVATVRSAR